MGIMQCIGEIEEHLRRELPDHYHAYVKINSRFLGDPVSRPRIYFVGVARPDSLALHAGAFMNAGSTFTICPGTLQEAGSAKRDIACQASEAHPGCGHAGILPRGHQVDRSAG